MKIKIKYLIVVVCFIISCYCFLIRLPIPFRHVDKELHAIFFFLAAVFLNILFKVKKLNSHLLIFGMLFLFGALIEFTQEYSNNLFHKKIHGNFDQQDLKFDLLGLLSFSIIWFLTLIVSFIPKSFKENK